jgi:adenosine deaminase
MRAETLGELAAQRGVRLPAALRGQTGSLADTASRGWFRFQRLYDLARTVVTEPELLRRVVSEIAADERAAGSGWVEIQVDPTPYAAGLGGLVGAMELLTDAGVQATAATGVGIGWIVAANRTRHPLEAKTLARLSRRFADRGVVGFGLSNDETRGSADQFADSFRIARSAGLLCVPHGGELRGPESVRACVRALGADRIGHGVRVVEDPATLAEIAERGVTLEVCPASNVALGVVAAAADVPLAALLDAGVPVALGADDPLLFGSGLVAQYELVRSVHGLPDRVLAELARASVRGSAAPPSRREQLLRAIDGWLAGPGSPPTPTGDGPRP